MKKILMISYHFHPDLAVGAQRSIKFAKYLPEHGWEPIILTVHSKYYEKLDSSPLDYSCQIYRTMKFPVLDNLYLSVKSLWNKPNSSNDHNNPNPNKETNSNVVIKKTPLWKRCLFSLSQTPDNRIGWIVPGVFRAMQLIRKENIEVVFSTGPPWTCHIIGLCIRILCKIKWVADFRDPWTLYEKPEEFETVLSRKFEQLLERKVINKAHIILTTTDEFKIYLQQKYSSENKKKFYSIINGFDSDDFRYIKKKKNTSQKIEILYAGSMYLGRDPYNLIISIGKLLQDNFISRDEIRIKFLSGIILNSSKYTDIIKQYNLESVVITKPLIPRDKYLHEIINSDILILMQSSQNPTQIPAKAFDYLATGNLILALVDSEATINILNNHKAATIVKLSNVNKIKEGLKQIIIKIRNHEKLSNDDSLKLEAITKKELTKLLAENLNNI